MNRATFLEQLRRRLAGLPQEEVDAALTYYNEYFDDAGPEREAEAIASLGSPEEVAAQVLGDYALRNPTAPAPAGTKKRSNVGWILLCIFAAPIGLPIALGIALTFILLLMALAMVILAVLLAAVSLIAGGLVSGVAGGSVLAADPFTGLLFLGLGLSAVGLGLLVWVFGVFLARKGFSGIAWIIRKCIRRKSE